MVENLATTKLYTNKEWLAEQYQKHTSREIAKMIGVGKTTILRWLKKHGIPSRTKARPYAHCKRLPTTAFSPSFELGYILGVFFGDGNIVASKKSRQWRFSLITASEEFAVFFANMIRRWAGLETKFYKEPKTKISDIDGRKIVSRPQTRAYVDSKIMVEYLLEISKGKKAIPNVCLNDVESLKGFISGFFDSEGSVYLNKSETYNGKPYYRLVIKVGNTNLKVIQQLREGIIKLGYHPTSIYRRVRENHKDYFSFCLMRQYEVQQFLSEVWYGYKSLIHLSRGRQQQTINLCD